MKEYFGEFGGQFVPEPLKKVLNELGDFFKELENDREFKAELEELLKNYSGRPTPLYFAKNLSEKFGNKIYLKREDLNHMGAHKINNTLGQALLASKMGKKKIVAETGAGQHGLACATVAAKFGFECKIFMGEEDIKRQKLNVNKMKILGAEVIPVTKGEKTLKEAVDEAINYWVENSKDTFYMLGSAVGPYPYPYMVRYFQSVIGREAKLQIIKFEGKMPDKVIACIGGGSNAMGIFSAFIDETPELIAVEAGGKGLDTDKHAASITKGEVGVIHGMKTYVLKDKNGDIKPVYSIAAGLDYPGIGPEISYLYSIKRLKVEYATDDEALEAFKLLAKYEGIIPAIESAHALAYLLKDEDKGKNAVYVINLSGRGDKDMYREFKFD